MDHPEVKGDEGDRAGPARAHVRQRGAASQRLLLALAASTILTAVVTLPMAYRAHEGRQDADADRSAARTEVLGTTVERRPVDGRGLYWASAEGSRTAALHRATVQGSVRLSARADDVVRADFRLDDGVVQTDREAPWEYAKGEPVALGTPGAETSHSLTVVLTHRDGRSTLRQALFTHDGT